MTAYKMFKTDPSMETDGIWLDYGDFKIRIARAGGSNVRFASTLERLTQPHKSQIKNGLLSPEAARKIMAETYATAVIVGWENVADESGKVLEFTHDNVVKVLTDLPALFDDIQEQANSIILFRKATLELAAKNS